MREKFISICILSYNRPETLERLLRTIDLKTNTEFEIVICDDCSPRKKEIAKMVRQFQSETRMNLIFIENKDNLGYDKTFQQLVKIAKGDWLIFMGDDDEFVPGALSKVSDFLKDHPELGYILKSHFTIFGPDLKEPFRYFPGTQFFEPSPDSYIKLFRRSVFIAGFMIQRKLILPFLTDRFDGSMLIQLYFLAEVVLKHRSAYLDLPFTQQYASHEHNKKDVMYDRGKKVFVARKPTFDISLNFLKSFSKITEFMDAKYGLNSTQLIKNDMSKYFYPSLSVHRPSGIIAFLKYVAELNKLGFNCTIYYYIYVVLLLIFGKRVCDRGILALKRLIGHTPQL